MVKNFEDKHFTRSIISDVMDHIISQGERILFQHAVQDKLEIFTASTFMSSLLDIIDVDCTVKAVSNWVIEEDQPPASCPNDVLAGNTLPVTVVDITEPEPEPSTTSHHHQAQPRAHPPPATSPAARVSSAKALFVRPKSSVGARRIVESHIRAKEDRRKRGAKEEKEREERVKQLTRGPGTGKDLAYGADGTLQQVTGHKGPAGPLHVNMNATEGEVLVPSPPSRKSRGGSVRQSREGDRGREREKGEKKEREVRTFTKQTSVFESIQPSAGVTVRAGGRTKGSQRAAKAGKDVTIADFKNKVASPERLAITATSPTALSPTPPAAESKPVEHKERPAAQPIARLARPPKGDTRPRAGQRIGASFEPGSPVKGMGRPRATSSKGIGRSTLPPLSGTVEGDLSTLKDKVGLR
ncbi:hypothetical protein J8273_8368 [Carpediemonas membranifera]|uniref:Uncharacterized protein n=1 Tax=Carpediemonas membranifera TaxID=201153 RepID=A0A8J6DX93_9EUKA|nr:hypothetical protein J8273_8368 [Carpediemonas membranifera]|eukprot:KAG9389694.1 hypothetical protein J8273_8368 [Carpediemonas membranifera]